MCKNGGIFVNFCICDDDKSIHQELNKLITLNLDNNTEFDIINVFSAEELIEKYQHNQFFDIIFLDVEMKSLSGIDAAKIIRELHPSAIIIFISNHPHYVFEVFKVEALHFLVKPISFAEFKNVFTRALHKYKTTHTSITLKWQNERYVIKANTIKYIEGYKRHITVYTTEDTYEALGKIPDLLKELSPHGFIRTHQGFLVNMDYIKRFDATDVVLFDGTKVMISVRKRAEALQAFDKYLKSRKW